MYFDNLHFSCVKPHNLYGTFTPSSDILLTWSAGSDENNWDLEWGPAGFSQNNGTLVSISSIPEYTIAGADTNMAYDFYVRSICDTASISSWAGPFTVCAPKHIPIYEDFEALNYGAFPLCWTKYTTGWDIKVVDWGGYNSQNALEMQLEGWTKSYIASPALNADINDLFISFYAHQTWHPQTSIIIGTMSNPNNPATFDTVSIHTLSNQYAQISHYFNDYTGTDKYIALMLSAPLGENAEAYIDDIVIDFLPSCIPPAYVNVDTVLTTEAAISWDVSSHSAWNIVYGYMGFDPSNDGIHETNLTSPSTYLTGLTSGTTYDIYVQAVCNVNDESSYIKETFTTLCDILNVPVFEDFEGYFASNMPNCWSSIIYSGWGEVFVTPWGGVNSSSALNMRLDSPGDSIFAVTPEIYENLNDLYISFHAYEHTYDTYTQQGNAVLTLGVMNDPNDASTFTPLQNFMLTDQHQSFEYLFDNYSGNASYIAFLLTTPGYNYTEIFIDDVLIDFPPTCFVPQNIQVNVQGGDANVSWDPAGSESYWNLIYAYEWEQNWLTYGTRIDSIDVSHYTIHNLDANQHYSVYLQTICDTNDFSSWSGAINFQTACLTIVAPYFYNFDDVHEWDIPACWERIHQHNDHSSYAGLANFSPLSHPNHIFLHNGDMPDTNAYLMMVTPLAEDVNDKQIRFSAKATHNGTPLDIMYSHTQWDPHSFVHIATLNLMETYDEYIIPLSSVHGDVYLAFSHGQAYSGSQTGVFVDDFYFELPASCPSPSQITFTPVANDAVLAEWNDMGTFNEWEIEYGIHGFLQGDGNMFTVTPSPNHLFQGLNTHVSYDMYIRTICELGDTGTWAGPFTFMPIFMCNSNSVHGQNPNPFANFLLGARDYDDRILAQSFSGINTTFNEIQLWAALGTWDNEFQECYLPSIDLEVAFYEDNSGQIGQKLSTFIINTLPDSTNVTLGGGQQVYEFLVQLPENINMTDGWFSVSSVNSPQCFTWFGMTSNPMASGELYLIRPHDQILRDFPLAYCFNYDPNACQQPVYLSTDILSTDTVVVSWQTGHHETIWNLAWGLEHLPVDSMQIINDLTSMQATLFGLLPGVNYAFYVQANCGGGTFSSWAGPHNIYITPMHDLFVDALVEPADENCNDLYTDITIRIGNMGSDTLSGNYDVTYSVWGIQTVSETVNTPIPPGETIEHTFATPLSLSFAGMDTTVYLSTYVTAVTDPNPFNDTLVTPLIFYAYPDNPVAVNDTVASGQTATLTAYSNGQIEWFDDYNATTPIHVGSAFTTPPVYADQTYYVHAINGSPETLGVLGPHAHDMGINYFTEPYDLYKVFDVHNTDGITIESIDIVFFEPNGTLFTVYLYDSNNIPLLSYSDTIKNEGGIQTIPVDFYVPNGSGYKIGFGTPIICGIHYNNNNPFPYPYEINNAASITHMEFQGSPLFIYYVYFFNWQIKIPGDVQCTSDKVEVKAVLDITPCYEFVHHAAICDGEVYNWRGVDYSVSGTYTDSVSTGSCDSIFVLHLAVNPIYEFVHHAAICDGEVYNWRGMDYSIAGTYYDNLLTAAGCDSIYVLYLHVNPVYEFVHHAAICDGDIYTWRGNDFTVAGTYYDNLLTAAGCDSIFVLNLEVKPVYEFVHHAAICDGEVYNWRGMDYSLSGTYTDSINTGSCDSIFVLHLAVNPVYEFVHHAAICDGEVYNWRGMDYSIAGTYYDNLLTAAGCDSIFVLYLEVNPVYEFVHHAAICDGDIYTWRGNDFTVAGTYYDNLLTAAGCDSIFVLNLDVNPVYEFVHHETICHNEVYNWRGVNYSVAGTYYDSLQTVHGCDSIYILNLVIEECWTGAAPIANLVSVNDNDATIEWTLMTGTVDYHVWLVGYGVDTVDASTYSNPYEISGLNSGTNYNVRVRAVGPGGVLSSWSNVVSFTTTGWTGAAPIANLVSVNDNDATIEWTLMPGTVDYHVLIIGYGVDTVDASTYSNPYEISGLNSGTNYNVRVRAVGPGGVLSSWSNVVSFTTTGWTGAAPIISLVNGSETVSSADIEWAPLQDAVDYHVWVVGYGIDTVDASTYSNPYEISGLSSGTDYDVRVRGVGPGGALSPWSNIVNFSTLDFTASLVAVDDHEADIEWPMIANATDYEVWIIGQTINVVPATGLTMPYTITGLNSGTSYNVRVRALNNGAAITAWSNIVNFTTTGWTGAAPAISLVPGSETDHTAQIEWALLSSVESYQVWVFAHSLITIDAATFTPPHTITGLNPGTSYDVRVRAVGTAGEISAWSNVVTFTTSSAKGDALAGLLESDGAEKPFVYPNPSTGNFMLILHEETDVTVFDASGRVVYSEKLTEGTHQMHFEHMAAGVYNIRAVGKYHLSNLKIVIKK